MDNDNCKQVAMVAGDVNRVVVIERHLEAKAELHEVKQGKLPEQRAVNQAIEGFQALEEVLRDLAVAHTNGCARVRPEIQRLAGGRK